MSPHEDAVLDALVSTLSVSNQKLAFTAIDQQIEHMAGTLLAFVQPQHHAMIGGAMLQAALRKASRQDPRAAAWAGHLLEIYRHHDKGAAS